MGKHRDKIDIMAKILNGASKNAGKTQIMYHANLNYNTLKRYITEIMDHKLMNLNDLKRYQITDKGRRFLETYQKYSKAKKHKERQVRIIRTRKKELEKLFSDRIVLSQSDAS